MIYSKGAHDGSVYTEHDDLERSVGSRKEGSSMASSVLRFNNIHFEVGRGDKRRYLLENVNGKVKWGHVLAVMGPSGAGHVDLLQSTASHLLTASSNATAMVRSHQLINKCRADRMVSSLREVVKQHDKHWPYLTARETLMYAASLYDVAHTGDTATAVQNIISKMGLDTCADTRAARLSGGQQRRLSLAMALLKQPTLLFLDEPTSGLDAAAASNIMQEIIRVAREERLIILCTIHQPSTKVYNGFDQVMILSQGREAFAGNVADAETYFGSIGYPVPPSTNPAEHFLDLVNSDFSSSEEVSKILDLWESRGIDGVTGSLHGTQIEEFDEAEGVADPSRRPFFREIGIMFRRHATLIARDPVLYLGRSLIFLIANVVFGFVYFSARNNTQDQASNKMWIVIWFIGVASNMGVVAVYALNDEFKSIQSENKNGMVSAISYILAKSILVIPIMFVFAIFALGIPGFAIQAFYPSAFGYTILIWAAGIYTFECAAECFAVVFDNPILGMLQFMNLWFGAFLFAGFLIPLRDLYWPFKLFYYIFPLGYYVRSFVYSIFIDVEWVPCTDPSAQSAVCVNSTSGKDVLDALSRVFPVISSENTVARDIGIMLAIALFWKTLSILAIVMKTSKVAPINSKTVINGRAMIVKVGTVAAKPTSSPHSVVMPSIHRSPEVVKDEKELSDFEYAV